MIVAQLKKFASDNRSQYQYNFFFIDNFDWFLYDDKAKLLVWTKAKHTKLSKI